MSRYCKAYPITNFRAYENWTENAENVRKEKEVVDGEEVEIDRTLTDEDFLYLHDNYVVTDGIHEDENVIFDDVTPEWKAYCTETLEFEIPDYMKETEEDSEEDSENNG